MSDISYLMRPEEIDSIVLGAAESMARTLGFTIAAPAKDHLLQKSFKNLNRTNEEGAIESRRAEIERNTGALITYITTERLTKGESGHEITYQEMFLGVSAFCRLFPDFFPFCTS